MRNRLHRHSGGIRWNAFLSVSAVS